MFIFKYYILEESISEIMSGNSNYLEDFEGQIELHFNDNQYGHIFPSISSYNELMLWWFAILNEASIKLLKNDYIMFYVPDTTFRFEMIKNGEYCIVNRVVTDYWPGGCVTTAKVDACEIITSGDKILVLNFVNEINEKTKSFIKEVIAINSKVEKSEQLEDIINLNRELECLVKAYS